MQQEGGEEESGDDEHEENVVQVDDSDSDSDSENDNGSDDGVVVEGDTKTQEDFEEGKKWLVESDRLQVEKGSDTTCFMEWVRRYVPTARYPEWSTGARREEDIVERQRLRTQSV